jgi:Spy/CpxP family protein refolding chaperone
MYPGFIYWRKRAQRNPHCGNDWSAILSQACYSPSESADAHRAEFSPGASFGVRRPLRFLAWKLDLDEKQTAELAKILADLKTERAQADVEDRRAASALADIASAPNFDLAKAKEATDLKVKSAGKVGAALVDALARLHTLLDPDQRERLAYLVRTGVVQL